MTVIELNEQQLQALVGLIDARVRASGIRGAKDAAGLIDIIEAAAAKSQNANNIVSIDKDASNG